MKSPLRPVMLTLMRAKTLVVGLAMALLLNACVIPHHTVMVQSVQTDDSGVPVHASGPMHNGHYMVVRGDTLYSIAFRAGVDFRDLARWNAINAPFVIYPGQRLRITPPPHPVGVPSKPVFEPVNPAPAVQHAATAVTGGTAAGAGQTAQVAQAESSTVPVAGEATQPSREPVSARSVPSAPTHEAGGVDWRWPASGALVSGFNAKDPIPGIEIAGHAGDPVRAAADGVVVYSGNGLVGYGELVIIKHNDTYLSAYGHNRKRLVHEGERVRAGQEIAEMGSSGAPRNELEFQVRRNGKPVDPQHYLPPR